MTEHKCLNCGYIFTNGICCPKCGTVFLFEEEYESKPEIEKQNEKNIEKENYEIANDIVHTNPQNKFEATRKEIIEDLLRQKEAREKEKERQAQELKLRLEKEAEEARKKAEEEEKERLRLEEEKRIEEERIEREKQLEEERKEQERQEIEKRYEEIRRLEQEKNTVENNDTDVIAECEETQEELINAGDDSSKDIASTKIYKREELLLEETEKETLCEPENTDDTLSENEVQVEEGIQIEEHIEVSDDIRVYNVPVDDNIAAAPVGNIKNSNTVTAFTKALRYLMIAVYSVTILLMILPFTEIMNMELGSNLSITNLYIALPLACGLIIAIFEKAFIRKYIVGVTLSLFYIVLYVFLTRPLLPVNIKDILYFALFALTFALSLTGIINDKSCKLEKMNVWFDFVVYIILIIGVFILVFMTAIWLITPGFVSGIVRINFYCLFAVTLLSIVSCILMLRRKKIGVDLFLLAAIGFILLIIFSYDQMMNFVGYGLGNDYMHLIGTLCAISMGVCVIVPLSLFVWLRVINAQNNREV